MLEEYIILLTDELKRFFKLINNLKKYKRIFINE